MRSRGSATTPAAARSQSPSSPARPRCRGRRAWSWWAGGSRSATWRWWSPPRGPTPSSSPPPGCSPCDSMWRSSLARATASRFRSRSSSPPPPRARTTSRAPLRRLYRRWHTPSSCRFWTVAATPCGWRAGPSTWCSFPAIRRSCSSTACPGRTRPSPPTVSRASTTCGFSPPPRASTSCASSPSPRPSPLTTRSQWWSGRPWPSPSPSSMRATA
mmetsp:Transcript_54518/g.173223  ORF Transcript_54518/g.173223 Transcript_54518/m.173223 type:complete len:215 (+) Transcript_54518:686-1330(+)